VLMIADPRLTGRDYGRQIFNSLPGLPKTRDEQKVLQFIDELALHYESIID
jgi:ATP-dependent DNA helicase DinG